MGRFLCAALVLVTGTARAQTLTEQEVVRRALSRPDLVAVIAGRVDAARGRSLTAGARPNPQINYVREQTYNSKGTGEDYLSVAQTIQLGGRYRIQQQAGAARARAREHEGRDVQLAIATDVRARFYTCLHRARRVTAIRALLEQVEQALAIVSRREASGDAALYDRRRLERERALTVARLDTESAHAARERHRLAAVLNLDAQGMSLSGTLLPEEELSAQDALLSTSLSRPDLLALEEEREGASLDAKAARRSRLPELRLEGGYKGIELNTGGRTDGFFVGGYLTLPLWDRSAGLRRSAEAEGRVLGAEQRLIESQLEGEILGARAETAELRAAAVQLRDASARVSDALVQIAAAGYEGGELSLVELLDAYRGAAEDELTILDLELASRRARIELDRLTGAGLP